MVIVEVRSDLGGRPEADVLRFDEGILRAACKFRLDRTVGEVLIEVFIGCDGDAAIVGMEVGPDAIFG
jgi:hypothetical protein